MHVSSTELSISRGNIKCQRIENRVQQVSQPTNEDLPQTIARGIHTLQRGHQI